MARKHLSLARKRALVARCEAAGHTIRTFAADNGIPYSTFCRWWRKYRQSPRRAGCRSASDELRVVEVQVIDPPPPPPAPPALGLELELPGGHSLRFEEGVDPNYVAALIVAAAGAAAC